MYDAYLLMPTAPCMLDARDAYLAADLMRAGDPSISWPSNQNELWLAFARRGFGANAFGTNDLAGTATSTRSRLRVAEAFAGDLRFNAQRHEGGGTEARIYVGHFEARVSPSPTRIRARA